MNVMGLTLILCEMIDAHEVATTLFFSVFIFKVFVVVKALSGKLIDIYIC